MIKALKIMPFLNRIQGKGVSIYTILHNKGHILLTKYDIEVQIQNQPVKLVKKSYKNKLVQVLSIVIQIFRKVQGETQKKRSPVSYLCLDLFMYFDEEEKNFILNFLSTRKKMIGQSFSQAFQKLINCYFIFGS